MSQAQQQPTTPARPVPDWLFDLRSPQAALDADYLLPPSPSWTKMETVSQPSSQASNVSQAPPPPLPPPQIVYKWTTRLMSLVASAPDLSLAREEQIASWLGRTDDLETVLDSWGREVLYDTSVYLRELHDWVLIHAQKAAKKTRQPNRSPTRIKRRGSDRFAKVLREEINLMARHASEHPTFLLLQCNSSQEVIDELARNRVWDLPWFMSWKTPGEKNDTKTNVMRRGAFLQTYFDLIEEGRMQFTEDMRGPVMEEAIFLLSWEIFWPDEDAPHPLPNLNSMQHLIDWEETSRTLQVDRSAEQMKSLWNYDLYSSLFIEGGLGPCNEDKPSTKCTDLGRVTNWMEAISHCVKDTIEHHKLYSSAFTVEMARVLIPIVQNALDWMIETDDYGTPVDLMNVSRGIVDQLVVRANGRQYGRVPRALTQDALLQAKETMSENELDYKILQHTHAKRTHIESLLAAMDDEVSIKVYDPPGDSTKDLPIEDCDEILRKYMFNRGTDYRPAPKAEPKPGIDWKEKKLKDAKAYGTITKTIWKTPKPPKKKKKYREMLRAW
ncbi:hypothetical protein CALVIDRAFT_563077 [Calocera viscosa TUFC12733]|uniref:Uncharacterized protein n=1 Tax=Calocera viscosa (strain TUFC12733) TaxID=1330018 RepID=A0A167N2K6_CALVF|nr:hypothetical protein CALVIDRAFT_563077 [Calocera viscosa TUFC12733]